MAIKTLPLDKSKEEHIKAEIQHQLAMDHPNICRLLEVPVGTAPAIIGPWAGAVWIDLDPKVLEGRFEILE